MVKHGICYFEAQRQKSKTYKLQVITYKWQITIYKLQDITYKLQVMSYKLQVASYKLPITSDMKQVIRLLFAILKTASEK